VMIYCGKNSVLLQLNKQTWNDDAQFYAQIKRNNTSIVQKFGKTLSRILYPSLESLIGQRYEAG